MIATASKDGTIKIYNLATGAWFCALRPVLRYSGVRWWACRARTEDRQEDEMNVPSRDFFVFRYRPTSDSCEVWSWTGVVLPFFVTFVEVLR